MAAIDDLSGAVGSLETSSATVLALVETLAGANQDAALGALTGRVAAVTSALDASVTAHTAPPPPVP